MQANPEWVPHLFPHIRLNLSQIERLELIRRTIDMPVRDFVLHLNTHPECTKMLQRELYRNLIQEGVSPRKALHTMIVSRFRTAQMQGQDLFGLLDMDEEDIDDAVDQMIDANNYTDVEQVAEDIVAEERSLAIPPEPELQEIARQVTLILRER